MSIRLKSLVLGIVVAVTVFCLVMPSAHAIKPFKDEFEAKYVKADSKAANDVALAAAVAEAKCNICHMPGSKKKRNPYGQQLGKVLKADRDADNKPKIQSALDEVAKMKSAPADPNAPTFGDLIKQGKLPAGKK